MKFQSSSIFIYILHQLSSVRCFYDPRIGAFVSDTNFVYPQVMTYAVHPENDDSGSGFVECGTRTVDFQPRRSGKIVGGLESPYGAFPWQVYNFFKFSIFSCIMHIFLIFFSFIEYSTSVILCSLFCLSTIYYYYY